MSTKSPGERKQRWLLVILTREGDGKKERKRASKPQKLYLRGLTARRNSSRAGRGGEQSNQLTTTAQPVMIKKSYLFSLLLSVGLTQLPTKPTTTLLAIPRLDVRKTAEQKRILYVRPAERVKGWIGYCDDESSHRCRRASCNISPSRCLV